MDQLGVHDEMQLSKVKALGEHDAGDILQSTLPESPAALYVQHCYMRHGT